MPEPKPWHEIFQQITNNYLFIPFDRDVAPAPLRVPGSPDISDKAEGEYSGTESDGRPKLSHSTPLEGALSGIITMDWIARTPVLFGTQRNVQVGGQVYRITEPQRLYAGPDAPYVIPGRAIRGMIRQVLRIATKSKAGPVNSVQPTRRDPFYQNERLTKNGDVMTRSSGWLMIEGGAWVLKSASSADIAHSDYRIQAMELQWLAKNRPRTHPDGRQQFGNRNGQRIPLVYRTAKRNLLDWHKRFSQNYDGLGELNGYLVMSAAMENKQKEQVFCVPDADAVAAATPELLSVAITRLLEAYGKMDQQKGVPVIVPDGNLKVWVDEYFRICSEKADESEKLLRDTFHLVGDTKTSFRQDDPPGIPVYYYLVNGKLILGMTQIMKFPTKFTVAHMVKQSQTECKVGEVDWSDAMMGYLDGNNALRGRIKFGFAKTNAEPQQLEMWPQDDEYLAVTQMQPRPGYSPFYLRKVDMSTNGDLHSTYDTGSNVNAAGRKRYPVWKANQRNIIDALEFQRIKILDDSENPHANVTGTHSHLKFLVQGTRFTGKIKFQNLLPEELGALLWTLSLGDEVAFEHHEEPKEMADHCHVGGRARGFSFGNLIPDGISLENVRINGSNVDEALNNPRWQDYVEAFGQQMHHASKLSEINDRVNLARLRKLSNRRPVENDTLWFGLRNGGNGQFSDYSRLRKIVEGELVRDRVYDDFIANLNADGPIRGNILDWGSDPTPVKSTS